MKNNICNLVIERFLNSDKYEALPLISVLHCLRCKECRTLIRGFKAAEYAAKEKLFEESSPDDPIIMQITERIDSLYGRENKRPVYTISLGRWISAGCVLIAAILLFGVFSTADGAEKMQLLLYLCFALFITGYCAFFVGSNLNFFIKKIQNFRPV